MNFYVSQNNICTTDQANLEVSEAHLTVGSVRPRAIRQNAKVTDVQDMVAAEVGEPAWNLET